MKKYSLVVGVILVLAAPSVTFATTTPAGSNLQVQYNDNGVFGATAIIYDESYTGNPSFTVGSDQSIDIIGGLGGTTGGYVNLRGGMGNVDTGGGAVLTGSTGVNYFFADDSNVGLYTGGLALGFLNASSLSVSRTFSFPDATGTFGILEAAQTWSGVNIFSAGASATTTVDFGKVGDSSSHACFNTKNTDGDDISFYFVGTSMVVEANTCQ